MLVNVISSNGVVIAYVCNGISPGASSALLVHNRSCDEFFVREGVGVKEREGRRGMVAEGVHAVRVPLALSAEKGVDLPIMQTMRGWSAGGLPCLSRMAD